MASQWKNRDDSIGEAGWRQEDLAEWRSPPSGPASLGALECNGFTLLGERRDAEQDSHRAGRRMSDLFAVFGSKFQQDFNRREEQDFFRAASKAAPCWLHSGSNLLEAITRSPGTPAQFHFEALSVRELKNSGAPRGLIPLPLPSLKS